MSKLLIFIALILLSLEQEINLHKGDNSQNNNTSIEIKINYTSEINISNKSNNITQTNDLIETNNVEYDTEINNVTEINNFREIINPIENKNAIGKNNETEINNDLEDYNATKKNNVTEIYNDIKSNKPIKTNKDIENNNVKKANNNTEANNSMEANNLTERNNASEASNVIESNNFTEINNITDTINSLITNNFTEINYVMGTNNVAETNNYTKINNATYINNCTEINNVIETNNFSKNKNDIEINNDTEINNIKSPNNITIEITNIEKEYQIHEINNNFTKSDSIKKIEGFQHFEDCFNSSNCRKGFICEFYRCITKFEKDNAEILGLNDKNICKDKNECLNGKICFKHRCVDNSNQIHLRRKKNKNDTSVHLLFAGSIFLNRKAYKSGEKKNNEFDYNHLFKHIKDDIKKADLAIVDQETVFQTNKTKFKKKISNTPTELGDAIAKAGFKLVLHGTIYAYSKEEKGIKNTLKFWKSNYPDIHILGISKNLEDSKNDYYIFKKKGIKIGIINFSGFPDLIPKEKEFMVNIISNIKIENFIKKLKNETDFVIVCMNWGDKGSKYPNEDQIKWAKELVGQGVNLIIGNHPAYVQPISYIKSKGRIGLVFWSLGHLISDNKMKNTFIGALAEIEISKGRKGAAFISNYNLIPIINHKINTTDYSVYKLSNYSEKLGLKTSKNFSMKNLIKECQKIMGSFY